ncbi:MAG TPA: hypothetical protein VFF53_04585 [Geobacteraceae bacterium]|nr:hypothetical protein [Geobacteraceae bacterium]
MKPDETTNVDYHEIACQQVLAEDHSVFSVQWIVVPHTADLPMDSERLLELYLAYVKQFTRSLVRPVMGEDCLEFRLACSAIPLIKFAPPAHLVTPQGSCSTLHICGGVLVQPKECDRGQLDFQVARVGEGTRITLQLSDYCPLLLGSSKPSPWRRWLYRLTQASLHKVVTVRFLAIVYRQITGKSPKTRVVKVALRKGRAT